MSQTYQSGPPTASGLVLRSSCSHFLQQTLEHLIILTGVTDHFGVVFSCTDTIMVTPDYH